MFLCRIFTLRRPQLWMIVMLTTVTVPYLIFSARYSDRIFSTPVAPVAPNITLEKVQSLIVIPAQQKVAESAPEMVRIIHQSWKTPQLPHRFSMWSNSWKGNSSCLSTWEYWQWTDDTNRQFIQKFYPWFLPTYDGFPTGIFRADSVRYFYLYHYGGLYVDMDFECLQPFEHLLHNHTIVLAAMDGYCSFDQFHRRYKFPEGCVQNAFMYSARPKHEFWKHMIIDIMRHPEQNRDEEMRTGPSLMMNMLSVYRQLVDKNDIKIYPPKYFCPYSYQTLNVRQFCKDKNRMTDANLATCRDYFKKQGAYTVEYHTQSHGGGDHANLRVPIEKT